MQLVLPHTAYPDLEHIRKAVPISAVAEQLDLTIVGRMVHCWRPRIISTATALRLSVCKTATTLQSVLCVILASLSPIELVISVLAVELRRAVQWITSHFNVPPAPNGRHIQHQERWPQVFRVGTSGTALEMLVRSGIWASLSPAQTFNDSRAGDIRRSANTQVNNLIPGDHAISGHPQPKHCFDWTQAFPDPALSSCRTSQGV